MPKKNGVDEPQHGGLLIDQSNTRKLVHFFLRGKCRGQGRENMETYNGDLD